MHFPCPHNPKNTTFDNHLYVTNSAGIALIHQLVVISNVMLFGPRGAKEKIAINNKHLAPTKLIYKKTCFPKGSKTSCFLC